MRSEPGPSRNAGRLSPSIVAGQRGACSSRGSSSWGRPFSAPIARNYSCTTSKLTAKSRAIGRNPPPSSFWLERRYKHSNSIRFISLKEGNTLVRRGNGSAHRKAGDRSQTRLQGPLCAPVPRKKAPTTTGRHGTGRIKVRGSHTSQLKSAGSQTAGWLWIPIFPWGRHLERFLLSRARCFGEQAAAAPQSHRAAPESRAGMQENSHPRIPSCHDMHDFASIALAVDRGSSRPSHIAGQNVRKKEQCLDIAPLGALSCMATCGIGLHHKAIGARIHVPVGVSSRRAADRLRFNASLETCQVSIPIDLENKLSNHFKM